MGTVEPQVATDAQAQLTDATVFGLVASERGQGWLLASQGSDGAALFRLGAQSCEAHSVPEPIHSLRAAGPGALVALPYAPSRFLIWERGQWRSGRNLPDYVRVDLNRSVTLTMFTDQPYTYHAQVTARYPSNYFGTRVRLRDEDRHDDRHDNRKPDKDHDGRDSDHDGRDKDRDNRR